ncbi:MAG: hypothetical protein K2Q22_08285, partial [Cytophagales bacterium]|nr:hypothetical protein [Cytophagales bacterium]
KSKSNYHLTVVKSPRIERYFTINFIQSIFGGFSINDEGLNLQDKIKKEIENLETELPEIIKNDKAQALHILNTIGGNIFLLKNIDFTLLKQIDSEILAEMNKKEKENISGGGCSSEDSGCYGCSTWDSACSSWTSSGCNGTGCSDSTSSGCSGCSGCGGCGGD